MGFAVGIAFNKRQRESRAKTYKLFRLPIGYPQ